MNSEEEEEDSKFRLDRRRHNNIKDWAVILALVLNLGGLVWTAAKMTSALEQVQITTKENTQALVKVVERLYSLESRANLLELQVELNKRGLKKDP